jgi:glycosyltransferase involved in cell wall biosynthesis
LDVFVLTSKMETSPVSILEAMACGKPVVATRVGSVPQTVVEGRTGYLVAPGSADELAARILELLSDPGRAKAMGQAGRQEVVAHGSIGRMVEGYQAMLTGIYRRKAGGVK